MDLDAALVERWWRALGRPISSLPVPGSIVPPFALTGCTIFLLASHVDITGGVYWREQVTYHRPPRQGERATVVGRVEGTYVHDGRLYAVMASSTAGEDGRLLASSRSTGLQQYLRGDYTTAPGQEPPPGAPAADPARAAANPVREVLRALEKGRVFAGDPVTVTLAMMRALAGGDDRNPIHTDEDVARRAGLRAPIAGGPHVVAFAEAMLLDALGGEALSHGTHVDIRWVAPVYAGDAVTPSATVLAADGTAVVVGLEARANGRLAMTGTATIPLEVQQ